MTLSCARCGSTALILDVALSLVADYAKLRLDTGLAANSGSFWKRRDITTEVTRADVCGQCGLVMLKVDDPAALWAACQSARLPR